MIGMYVAELHTRPVLDLPFGPEHRGVEHLEHTLRILHGPDFDLVGRRLPVGGS